MRAALPTLAGWALLLGFGTYVVLVSPQPISGRSFAWLTAVAAAAWALGHVRTRLHVRRLPRGRDAKAELAFELGRGPCVFHQRAARVRPGSAGYAGRSHSGERPRYD